AFVCPIPTSAHTNYLINLLKSVLSETDALAFRLKRGALFCVSQSEVHILATSRSESTLFFQLPSPWRL
ncbi:hypothetical protein, partial [Marinobacterium nitratireducens]|uniref:hypothetical protein n=1 Tax=Marinobacterium nitratireducens TaxID=518897 RepID=UPI001E5AEE07